MRRAVLPALLVLAYAGCAAPMATQRTRAWSERNISRDARPYTDSVAVFDSVGALPRGYLHLADVFAQAPPSPSARDEALYALKIEARKIGADAVAFVSEGDTTVTGTSQPAPAFGNAPPAPALTYSADIYLVKARAYYWVFDRAPEWPASEADSSGATD